MFFSYIFLGLAILCVCWGIVSSIAIANYISKRGADVKWFFLNIMIINYINHYKILSQEETGRIGFWYYSFIISMNAAVVSALTGIVFILFES